MIIDSIVREFGSVAIAASIHSGEIQGSYSPIKNDRVRVYSLGLFDSKASRIGKLMNYLKWMPRMLQIIIQSKFIYIFTPGHIGLLSALLCWSINKPYGLYLRGKWQDHTPLPFQVLGRYIFSKAVFILCISEPETNLLKELNPNCEFEVPISPLLFYPVPVYRPCTIDGPVKILFVGQMIKEKGIFDLVDAVEQLHEVHHLDVELLLVGEGTARITVEHILQERRMSSYVHCFGMIIDPVQLSHIYQQSDIFCLPSYSEGFPRVIYEAMLYSLPIVTTDVGQIGAVIEDGFNGLFHAPGDCPSLTNCLLKLIHDPKLRITLGDSGYKTLEPLLRDWKKRTHGDQVVQWLESYFRYSATI